MLWVDDVNDVLKLLKSVAGKLPNCQLDSLLNTLERRHETHTCGSYCLDKTRKCRLKFPKPHIKESYYDPIINRYFTKGNDKDMNINDYHTPWLRV